MEKRKTFKDSFLDQLWIMLQHILPAKAYISLKYKVVFKKKINWSAPSSFNEKLQWLKLYGFRPEYTKMVDKITVKEYVKEIIGEEYIIPTLKVWDKPEDIDFNCLPDKFVLKCNHNSGAVLICTDKTSFDQANARKVMGGLLKDNYYLMGRETPYKYVKRKIFAEQYMQDEQTHDIRDYKFFCFGGIPKIMFIASDRATDVRFDFFDMDFKHLPIRQGYDNSESPIQKPQNFELMKELASKLSTGIPHVRVDLYEINGKVYFGELTFYHFSGFMPFEPPEWDRQLGDWLQLPKKTN